MLHEYELYLLIALLTDVWFSTFRDFKIAIITIHTCTLHAANRACYRSALSYATLELRVTTLNALSVNSLQTSLLWFVYVYAIYQCSSLHSILTRTLQQCISYPSILVNDVLSDPINIQSDVPTSALFTGFAATLRDRAPELIQVSGSSLLFRL